MRTPANNNRPIEADTPPTWRSVIVRGVGSAVIFGPMLVLIFGRSVNDALALAGLLLAFYIPTGYYVETMMWRRRRRGHTGNELPGAKGKSPEAQHEHNARGRPIPRSESALGGIVETVVIVVVALGIALVIQAWVVKPALIPSGSMEPTLNVGQRVFVNRFIYHFEDPGIGDIVVFHPPAGAKAEGIGGKCGVEQKNGAACPAPVSEKSSENFIKRIVAGPGDRLQIIHGQAIVNGEASEAANAAAQQNCDNSVPIARLQTTAADGYCNFPTPIVIPPDHYFFMGDNRAFSNDSRFWGPIPREWIIGKAFATFWPPDRWGFF